MKTLSVTDLYQNPDSGFRMIDLIYTGSSRRARDPAGGGRLRGGGGEGRYLRPQHHPRRWHQKVGKGHLSHPGENSITRKAAQIATKVTRASARELIISTFRVNSLFQNN